MQDEWDNLYHLGFFHNLKDAIPEVNSWLSTYNIEIDELSEYPSTFGMCFDIELEADDAYVHIRGFIFDKLQEE
jgi:hypothetical protein